MPMDICTISQRRLLRPVGFLFLLMRVCCCWLTRVRYCYCFISKHEKSEYYCYIGKAGIKRRCLWTLEKFGQKHRGYMSGGAGYVLSREAVRRFIEDALPNPEKCKSAPIGAEDVEIGKCLQNVNVIAGDSRDYQGRGRFFPFIPEDHLLADRKENRTYWYWDMIYYQTDEGLDCCSNNAISFHYVEKNQMYVYDYFLYHLRPFGRAIPAEVLPVKLEIGETERPPMDPIDGVTDLL